MRQPCTCKGHPSKTYSCVPCMAEYARIHASNERGDNLPNDLPRIPIEALKPYHEEGGHLDG